MRTKRILAGILLGAFVAVLLIPGIYITAHRHHDCIGDECSVCTVLSVCDRLLRSLAHLPLPAAVALFGLLIACARPARRFACFSAVTLVSLKVKLSN